MKIKIIDLLNKIAESKKLPEKFMYRGHLYYREKNKGICYRCDELNEIFEECLVLEDLNDTIEIIEEPKKIDKLDLNYKDIIYGTDFKKQILRYCDNLHYKINELIDEINNLINKDYQ